MSRLQEVPNSPILIASSPNNDKNFHKRDLHHSLIDVAGFGEDVAMFGGFLLLCFDESIQVFFDIDGVGVGQS
jgi:hypothetical protein